MSKNDYNSLSKEELIALLQQRDADLKSSKEALDDSEKNQLKLVSKLRDTITATKNDNAHLACDNKKLTVNVTNFETLLKNIVSYVKDINIQGSKLFDVSVVEDIKSVKDLEKYIILALCTAQESIRSLHYHQERSLNLSRTEKNGRRSRPIDDSVSGDFEKQAQAEGEDILKDEKEATVVENEDIDEADYNYLIDENDALNEEQAINNAIDKAHDDATYQKSVPQEVLNERDDPTINTTDDALDRSANVIGTYDKSQYQNEGVVTRQEQKFITTNDGSEIVSVIEIGDKIKYQRQCPH